VNPSTPLVTSIEGVGDSEVLVHLGSREALGTSDFGAERANDLFSCFVVEGILLYFHWSPGGLQCFDLIDDLLVDWVTVKVVLGGGEGED